MRGPKLRLVCVNDVYSLENLPRLRTLVRHHLETAPADAFLTTLAGDFLAPSLLSSLDRGAGMVDCLDAVPVTHVCFGNHEQDVPFDALVARVRQYRGVWLNTNVPGFEPPLPASQVIEVKGEGARPVRVGVIGVLTEEPTLYHPTAFGGHVITPANAAALAAARRLVTEGGCACVIALTHQSLDRDRALASAAGGARIPLIVGGHEHDPHVERAGDAWIVKAGMDAAQAAVVDLTWPAEAPAGSADLPAVSVRLEPVSDYDDDADLRARVERHMHVVSGLHAATLRTLGPGEALSSAGSRVRQTTVGAMLSTAVRDVLGADACFINGGGIRGNREYADVFTYGDLEAELPFPNEVVAAQMPGRVLREAILMSRSRAPSPAPGFLQVDDGVTVDARNVVTAIGGAPLDESRDYCVATVRVLFDGMDGVEPLVRFAREHPERVPARDSGRELKLLVVEAFARTLWRQLGSFDTLDADRDGRVSTDELRAAIGRTQSAAACDFFVDGILRTLDVNGDRAISRQEAERFKQLRRKA